MFANKGMSYAFQPTSSSFEQDEELGPFRTTDLLLLNQHQDKGSNARQWWLRRMNSPLGFWACQVAAPVSAVLSLIVMAVCLGLWLTREPAPREKPGMSLDCFLALGGGAVGPGGSFPRDSPEGCDKQIVDYLGKERNGKYFDEVKDVADEAISYFESLQPSNPGTPDQLMVFDIDETVLSNAAEWLDPQPDAGTDSSSSSSSSASSASEGGSSSTNTANVSTGGSSSSSSKRSSSSSSSTTTSPGRLLSAKDLKDRAQSKFDRPALEAVALLYRYLYIHNYSVAFITGRSEPSRNGTMYNLADAGLGTQCPESGNGSPPWGLRTEEPCYVALHLRDPSDMRLASIYKPERRKALQDAGFTLVGSMGDQFSDLSGLYPAIAGWKLPNPMYAIL